MLEWLCVRSEVPSKGYVSQESPEDNTRRPDKGQQHQDVLCSPELIIAVTELWFINNRGKNSPSPISIGQMVTLNH